MSPSRSRRRSAQRGGRAETGAEEADAEPSVYVPVRATRYNHTINSTVNGYRSRRRAPGPEMQAQAGKRKKDAGYDSISAA